MKVDAGLLLLATAIAFEELRARAVRTGLLLAFGLIGLVVSLYVTLPALRTASAVILAVTAAWLAVVAVRVVALVLSTARQTRDNPGGRLSELLVAEVLASGGDELRIVTQRETSDQSGGDAVSLPTVAIAHLTAGWKEMLRLPASSHAALIVDWRRRAKLEGATAGDQQGTARIRLPGREVEVAVNTPVRKHLRETRGVVLDCRIGLHLGPVALGAMGKGINTAVGDAVNIAFRIESLTRLIDRPALVSRAFVEGWEGADEAFESCGFHRVKGQDTPIEVFAPRMMR